jgi:putative spermidine/putrescine transport system substrate-binding protein
LINNTAAVAEFLRMTHYGSPNLDALKRLPKEDADQIPTSPALAAKLLEPDEVYWSEHLADLSKRFKQWQLS